MRHAGSVADRILAHGYGPGQLSLRAESLTLGLIEMCGSPGGNDAFTVGQREAPPTPPHSRLVAGLLPSAAPRPELRAPSGSVNCSEWFLGMSTPR
jgi:hypothetical protein